MNQNTVGFIWMGSLFATATVALVVWDVFFRSKNILRSAFQYILEGLLLGFSLALWEVPLLKAREPTLAPPSFIAGFAIMGVIRVALSKMFSI